LNERCEDGLDDLGAAGSEIVTLSDQFVHFSDDLFVNSNAEFLFLPCL
jgi:hypothetical protein